MRINNYWNLLWNKWFCIPAKKTNLRQFLKINIFNFKTSCCFQTYNHKYTLNTKWLTIPPISHPIKASILPVTPSKSNTNHSFLQACLTSIISIRLNQLQISLNSILNPKSCYKVQKKHTKKDCSSGRRRFQDGLRIWTRLVSKQNSWKGRIL